MRIISFKLFAVGFFFSDSVLFMSIVKLMLLAMV